MKAGTLITREMARQAAGLSRLLSKPTSRWNQEDRHQLRVSTRMFLALKKFTTLSERHSEAPKGLKKKLGRLLRDTGRVRDLDVSLTFLKSYPISSSQKIALLKRRGRALVKLRRNWSSQKRTELKKYLSRYKSSSLLVSEKKYLKQIRFFEKNLRRLVSKAPRKKNQLHQERIFLRKLRYFVMAMKGDFAELIWIQNKLGNIHDLENLRVFVGKNKILEREIRKRLKQLRKKNPKRNFKIKQNFVKVFI